MTGHSVIIEWQKKKFIFVFVLFQYHNNNNKIMAFGTQECPSNLIQILFRQKVE